DRSLGAPASALFSQRFEFLRCELGKRRLAARSARIQTSGRLELRAVILDEPGAARGARLRPRADVSLLIIACRDVAVAAHAHSQFDSGGARWIADRICHLARAGRRQRADCYSAECPS